jgi:biotin operon repressor
MKKTSLRNSLAEFFTSGGQATNAELAEKFNTTEMMIRSAVQYLRKTGLEIESIRINTYGRVCMYKMSEKMMKLNTKAIMVTKHDVIEAEQQAMAISHEEVIEFTNGLIGVDCGEFVSYNHKDYVIVVYK